LFHFVDFRPQIRIFRSCFAAWVKYRMFLFQVQDGAEFPTGGKTAKAGKPASGQSAADFGFDSEADGIVRMKEEEKK